MKDIFYTSTTNVIQNESTSLMLTSTVFKTLQRRWNIVIDDSVIESMPTRLYWKQFKNHNNDECIGTESAIDSNSKNTIRYCDDQDCRRLHSTIESPNHEY